jgi:RNA polymerase sigma-70 factor (ECF subfamily)
LHRNVAPAEHPFTGVSATGESVHGTGVFATTHWSVALEAQGESPAAQEALEKPCRSYWRPIYVFVRRQGLPFEDAEDLTQGFSPHFWSARI